MEGAFTGFCMRDGFHMSLGIQPFAFDRTRAILVASGSDPDVYTRAHELLRSYCRTHRFAVVVLANAWDGSPGVATIQHNIQENMRSSGWHRDRFEIIIIDPELEAWSWQDSPHVTSAFRFTQHPSLRQWLGEQGLWDIGATNLPVTPDLTLDTEQFLYHPHPQIWGLLDLGQLYQPTIHPKSTVYLRLYAGLQDRSLRRSTT